MSLFWERIRGSATSRPAATHDYTRRGWGHDYAIHQVIEGGRRLKASGWGHGIAVGDHLIMPNQQATTRYRVEAIRYVRDPTDQWFADLAFAPRAPEPPAVGSFHG